MTYDPESWLETTSRTIKQYVIDGLNAPNVWDVVMQFPGADIDAQTQPISKTIIHFEIDDIVERPLGFGDAPHRDNYDAAAGTIQPQWASIHEINFDVGIWASDRSGGTTSRMRARQHLTRLFGIPQGLVSLRNYSDNGDGVIELLRFSGGRDILDFSNDVKLYRMVDASLDIRVFSRTPLADAAIETAIDEIVQAPNLTILG